MKITQERVRELFDYRPDGALIWKVPRGTVKVGDVAGCITVDGYWQITVDKKNYRAHRLVWLWHDGYLPEHKLDHKDRDRSNNRRKNLREVGDMCNMRNTGNHRSNTSGVKGIYRDNQRQIWVAHITVNACRWFCAAAR